jgi:hypothetical protein
VINGTARGHATIAGGSEHRRQLSPAQELAGAILEGATEDLGLHESCDRFRLAIAWVMGRHLCGCPYEAVASDFTFEHVAELLGEDPRRLRARLVRSVKRRAPRGHVQRDEDQQWLFACV